MKKGLKKAGFVICVLASILLIGTTAAGWFNSEDKEKTDTKTETTQVQVVES